MTDKNLDGILHITTGKTVGFGWDYIIADKTDRKVCFGAYILSYIGTFATKCGNQHQNPTARSNSYWALGAQVPTQSPRLVVTVWVFWIEFK